jgi:cell division protein ZapA
MTTKSNLPAERMVQLDIKIMGREYKVACKEHERADLLEAVGFLDQRMHEIKEGGKITGVDLIAVMAALNLGQRIVAGTQIAHGRAVGYARATPAGVDEEDARRRIIAMQSAIDQTMAGQENCSDDASNCPCVARRTKWRI